MQHFLCGKSCIDFKRGGRKSSRSSEGYPKRSIRIFKKITQFNVTSQSQVRKSLALLLAKIK
jgi:hypothetical protein